MILMSIARSPIDIEPRLTRNAIFLPHRTPAATWTIDQVAAVVRLTTPSAGALAAHRLTRREIQQATVAEAEVAVGRKLVPGQWWLTTAGAKTTAIPQELVLEL